MMENLTPRQSYQATERRTSIRHYEVICTIGRGGMGEVLKALDAKTGRYIAIKVLDAEAYRDEDLLRRFEREAHSALTLDHPNIAKFYGMEMDEEGRPIIIMEFIEGLPMDQWLKLNYDPPFSLIVDFAIQAARGLENAYRRSIIHRDIKPSNLIVTPEQVVKIIDFGLAKSLWDNSALTSTGMVVGTPRYISPEQAASRSVDHRSDIYSLGATLYELLTRQVPFDGDTPLAIIMKHSTSPLVPPYLINPRVPSDINEIVIRMMAKDPKERYQDYEPLIRDLESAKIHRMAKERRMAGHDGMLAETQAVDYAAQTMIESNGEVSPTYRSRPSSYLSQGLVNVSYDLPEAPAKSRATVILLTISGLLVVGIDVAGLLAPKQVEGQKQSSWLSQRIAAVLGKNPTTKKSSSPADIAKDDAEKVRLTQSRMEALVSRILEQRAAQPNKSPGIRSMRDSGVVTRDETQDAWGNDFYILETGTSGGNLISKGRDGEEKTSDDFRFSLDGTSRTIPEPLKEEDLIVAEQKAKASEGR
jgi:serine/threonine protein kinase